MFNVNKPTITVEPKKIFDVTSNQSTLVIAKLAIILEQTLRNIKLVPLLG